MYVSSLGGEGGGSGVTDPKTMQIAPAPTGYAPAPMAAPAPAAPTNPWTGTSWDNGFLDLNKLQSVYQQYQAAGGRGGVDGQGMLSALIPLSGVHADPNDAAMRAAMAATGGSQLGGYQTGSGESAEWHDGPAPQPDLPVYQDAGGRMFRQTGTDANGQPLIQFFDNSGGGWANPTGNEHDRVQPTYSLGKDGSATPVDSGTSHQAGWWTDYGREIAKWAAVMGTAGAAGAYLGGAEGLAGAGGAGAAEGGAGAAEGMSGMDLAADAAAGTGNNIGTAAGSFGGSGSAGGSLANTGSDAHFYQPQSGGVGVQDLGNMGGAGTSTIPSMSLGGSGAGLGDYLKDLGKAMGKGGSGAGGNSNLAMLMGGGGGMTAGDRYRQQLTSQALRDQASQQAPQQMPGWIPGG